MEKNTLEVIKLLYKANFIKFRQDLSLKYAMQLCNQLKTQHIKPLDFKVKQVVKCNVSDIEEVFTSCLLPKKAKGYLSTTIENIWQCIVLQAKDITLIVYTSGHQAPMYISVAPNLDSYF